MSLLFFEYAGRNYRVAPAAHDLSIPVDFGPSQVECFGAPPAQQQALRLGGFVGDVREGGSCNCATVTITPHCNGTHTEGVGHISDERLHVRQLCHDAITAALLITVQPEAASQSQESGGPACDPRDLLVTSDSLQRALTGVSQPIPPALVIRTLPNEPSKRTRHYSEHPAPYFSAEAMRSIVESEIEHLIVDLPSLDRAQDQGLLTAHRIFWNVPNGARSTDRNTRMHATVTELAYIGDEVPDGLYLLNLQLAPLDGDAVPSRPLLMALHPV